MAKNRTPRGKHAKHQVSAIRHAHKRFAMRFNENLQEDEMDELCFRIRNKQEKLIRFDDEAMYYFTALRGCNQICVFDKKLDCVVTFFSAKRFMRSMYVKMEKVRDIINNMGTNDYAVLKNRFFELKKSEQLPQFVTLTRELRADFETTQGNFGFIVEPVVAKEANDPS